MVYNNVYNMENTEHRVYLLWTRLNTQIQCATSGYKYAPMGYSTMLSVQAHLQAPQKWAVSHFYNSLAFFFILHNVRASK